jgi:Fanconi anemia group I protein
MVVSFEKDVFRRMGKLAQALAGIGALASQASIKLAQSSIHAFAVLYRTLAMASKSMMRRNEFTLDQTLEFVNKIHGITPDVYSIIGEVQCLGENEDMNHQNSRVELKELPTLIFQMEEWEKHVVHLSRKLNVNLMANAKRTVNRDFKVKFGRKDLENLTQ